MKVLAEGDSMSDLVLGVFGPEGGPVRPVSAPGAVERATDSCVLGDHLVVGGHVIGSTSLDGWSLGSAGENEGFVLFADADLRIVAALPLRGAGAVRVDALACDEARGVVWVGGVSDGDLSVGDPPLAIDGSTTGAFLVPLEVR